MQIRFAEQVRIMLDRKNISISQLAEMTGTTRQNMSQKLKDNNFDIAWMQKIAAALGTKVRIELEALNEDITDQKEGDAQ